jgi:hypothetical protein
MVFMQSTAEQTQMTTTAADLAWWERAVEQYYSNGTVPEMTEDPQCGFYQAREGGMEGPFTLVMIFRANDGNIAARIGANAEKRSLDNDQLRRIWIFAAKRPINRIDGTHFFRRGEWLNEPPPMDPHTKKPAPTAPEVDLDKERMLLEASPAPIGHNAPPPSESGEIDFESILDDLTQAENWIRDRKILTRAEADKAQNWAARLRAHEKIIEAKRVAEREPHNRALQAIQDFFLPKLARLKTPRTLLEQAVQAFGRKLQEEEEKKAREKAERQAAEENARMHRLAMEHGVPTDFEPQAPVQVKAPKIMFGGASGHRVGIKKPVACAVIQDIEKLLIFLKNDPDMIALAQKKADKIIKAGGEAPGCARGTKQAA